MKGKLFLIALAASALIAHADPIGFITLDANEPMLSGSHYSWEYTVSVSGGDLNDIDSIIIDGVGGVVSLDSPQGWHATFTPDGPGLSDVTFTRLSYRDAFKDSSSLDGFYINSLYGVAGMADYTVTYSNHQHDSDPVVGAPAATTPEPGSLALALSGVAALAIRRMRRRAV